MKPRHLLFGFLAVLTLLRLIYISQVELAADESYYYLWSQHLDWSYYSKGPGVALAIRLGTALFGANEFGVRVLSPVLALGTSLVVFFFARRLYSESVAIWTVLTINAMPIFNVGGLLMTIDPLSIFFWAAALFTFWLALENCPRFSLYWPLTGLLIGFGFLAKYTNAMQLLSIVLILALTRKYRYEFLHAGFYSLLGAFGLCTLPVILWNRDHAWITLTHLRSRGNLNTGFALHPMETLSFLGAHLLVYSPLIFIGMILALWWARDEARVKLKARFLALFSLPLFVMYGLLALKKAGQPNWTAPAFVSLGILATAIWHEEMQSHPARQKWVAWALAVGMAMTFGILNTDVIHRFGFPYKWDPISRVRGWQSTAIAVEDFREKFEQETGKPVFLIGNKYQTSSLLSFYLPGRRTEGPGHPPVYIPESPDIESEFTFWPKYDDFVDAPKGAQPASPDSQYYTEENGVNVFLGRNALYITDEINDEAPSAIQRGFERVEMVTLLDITRHGLPLHKIRIFACYNYQTVPL